MYKARVAIAFEFIQELGIFYSDNFSIPTSFQDPRTQSIGFRIMTNNNTHDKCASNLIDYHTMRIKALVPDGYYDMESGSSIPINFNMHNLNAISLTKGCYLGQETTNRLFRTSVLRKKLEYKNARDIFKDQELDWLGKINFFKDRELCNEDGLKYAYVCGSVNDCMICLVNNI